MSDNFGYLEQRLSALQHTVEESRIYVQRAEHQLQEIMDKLSDYKKRQQDYPIVKEK